MIAATGVRSDHSRILITLTVIELIKMRSLGLDPSGSDDADEVRCRAISAQLAMVIKGQQRSLADTCLRRSAAIRDKIGMICKQEVRKWAHGSPTVYRVISVRPSCSAKSSKSLTLSVASGRP